MQTHLTTTITQRTRRRIVLQAVSTAATVPILGHGGEAYASSIKAGDWVNHAGRKLPTMPKIVQPIMFDSPLADTVLAAMQVMPKNSPWNEDISRLPVLPHSTAMIEQIGASKPLSVNYDMAFVIVPPTQPLVPVDFVLYPNESDPGPYPIPVNAPIEGWPLQGGSLSVLQRVGEGDRHVIVLDPFNQKLYEIGEAYKTDAGWKAGAGAIFDLNTNRLRPEKWTSADAAGLPILPGVIRFDELERGLVEHAMRFTVQRTRREYIYPATHYASRLVADNIPAMGQRFRLKADANLDGLPKHAISVARGLQKFGMIVADNGGDWRLSVAPDRRIQGLGALRRFKGTDFEVIRTTGQFEGPRA